MLPSLAVLEEGLREQADSEVHVLALDLEEDSDLGDQGQDLRSTLSSDRTGDLSLEAAPPTTKAALDHSVTKSTSEEEEAQDCLEAPPPTTKDVSALFATRLTSVEDLPRELVLFRI